MVILVFIINYKCYNNDSKIIALMGLLSYNLIMTVVSLITSPEFIIKINVIDMINMLPGILMQSMGFYCMISATKYRKVAITSSITKARVFVTFLLGIIILKEKCTLLQLFVSIILVVFSIIVAKNKNDIKNKIDKKLEQKAIMYFYGFVLFNGISSFF